VLVIACLVTIADRGPQPGSYYDRAQDSHHNNSLDNSRPATADGASVVAKNRAKKVKKWAKYLARRRDARTRAEKSNYEQRRKESLDSLEALWAEYAKEEPSPLRWCPETASQREKEEQKKNMTNVDPEASQDVQELTKQMAYLYHRRQGKSERNRPGFIGEASTKLFIDRGGRTYGVDWSDVAADMGLEEYHPGHRWTKPFLSRIDLTKPWTLESEWPPPPSWLPCRLEDNWSDYNLTMVQKISLLVWFGLDQGYRLSADEDDELVSNSDDPETPQSMSDDMHIDEDHIRLWSKGFEKAVNGFFHQGERSAYCLHRSVQRDYQLSARSRETYNYFYSQFADLCLAGGYEQATAEYGGEERAKRFLRVRMQREVASGAGYDPSNKLHIAAALRAFEWAVPGQIPVCDTPQNAAASGRLVDGCYVLLPFKQNEEEEVGHVRNQQSQSLQPVALPPKWIRVPTKPGPPHFSNSDQRERDRSRSPLRPAAATVAAGMEGRREAGGNDDVAHPSPPSANVIEVIMQGRHDPAVEEEI